MEFSVSSARSSADSLVCLAGPGIAVDGLLPLELWGCYRTVSVHTDPLCALKLWALKVWALKPWEVKLWALKLWAVLRPGL